MTYRMYECRGRGFGGFSRPTAVLMQDKRNRTILIDSQVNELGKLRKAQAPAQMRTNWKECAEIKETRRRIEMLKGLAQMRQA